MQLKHPNFLGLYPITAIRSIPKQRLISGTRAWFTTKSSVKTSLLPSRMSAEIKTGDNPAIIAKVDSELEEEGEEGVFEATEEGEIGPPLLRTNDNRDKAREKKPVRNAFTELMSKPTPLPIPATKPKPHSRPHGPGFADALYPYIAHPERYPLTTVLRHNPSFVTIADLYPKSAIHLLILPRNPEKSLLHPFDALADPVFLAKCKAELEVVKDMVASELRRRYGRFSKIETARQEWEEKQERQEYEAERERKSKRARITPPSTTTAAPPPRNYHPYIKSGIHAHPSMTHLHIHVLSADHASPCLKKKRHYNSFTTDFLVPLDAFPLAKDDVRRRPGKEGYLHRDMRCWRCGMGFGASMVKLKAHLEEEFEAWKRE